MMDALQLKVESVRGEVGEIRSALRDYLEQGIASGRKVQPPKTKAGRDHLHHLLGRLDQVFAGLGDICNPASHDSPPSPLAHRPGTPPSYHSTAGPQQAAAPVEPAAQPSQSLKGGLITHPSPPASSGLEAADPIPKPEPAAPGLAAPSAVVLNQAIPSQEPRPIILSNGSVYQNPLLSQHAAPLFDCTYQDIHFLNEELFELYSRHPVVRDRGYFKIQVRDLPPLNVQKMARPSKDHATSFSYKADQLGLVKVDTGKRFKFASPNLPLPMSAKMDWSLPEQQYLWNSSAADPPKGTWPYIIGNPLFDDVELSPGEKLRSRGRAVLEGINTQYVYFNLTGKTITTMHREDAHVRSENLLRSGQHKFWCFVKPAHARRLEERMAYEYPEMRRCSQAVRHLSRHIPPAKLDEWGVEYTLDYCVPGQAVVTEPGTYHQVLNLGPNYAIAINLEYSSSPDMPIDYRFCDKHCPDKFAMTAEDFRIHEKSTPEDDRAPRTPETTGSQERHASVPGAAATLRHEVAISSLTPATPPPEQNVPGKHEAVGPQLIRPEASLSKPVGSEGQEQQAYWDVASMAASFPGPLPQTEPKPHPPASKTTLGPNVAGSCSAGHLKLVPEQLSKAETAQLFKQTSPFTSQSLRLPAGAAAEPVQQRENEAQLLYSPSQAVARFTQTPSPHLSANFQAPDHRFGTRPLVVEVPPIRKTARMINPERELDTATERPPKKRRLQLESAQSAQDTLAGGAFAHLSAFLRGRETARPGSAIAEELCGKAGFDRLSRLVCEWRRYTKSMPMVLGGFQLVKTADHALHQHPDLHTFLMRFIKMQAAAFVVSTTADPVQRSPEVLMNKLLQILKWDETQRHRLHDFLREGSCWRTICGGYDGLLCLLPPEMDCIHLALFKDDLAAFHSELNTSFVRRLCAVGSTLQRSIWECLELPEFVWESAATTWLRVDEISPLLAPFRMLKANHYDSNCWGNWPQPARWRWIWPVDPSVVIPDDSPCEFCPGKSCYCIGFKVPQVPRISDDGSKGPGIRSLGSHRANDILGELVGELLPLGSCRGDWMMVLRRPDLDDEAVAEIYPRRMGNWVRKVNHNTNPSATFKAIKISGRWRQMLVAIRDIADGDEITAKYGKGFFKKQPYSVVEGLH